jgi:hypothetical protein
MVGECSTNGEKKNACRILVGNLGLPRRRWVGSIKMNLRGKDGMVWIGLIWLRIGISGELF